MLTSEGAGLLELTGEKYTVLQSSQRVKGVHNPTGLFVNDTVSFFRVILHWLQLRDHPHLVIFLYYFLKNIHPHPVGALTGCLFIIITS